jgi:hypothetical protein
MKAMSEQQISIECTPLHYLIKGCMRNGIFQAWPMSLGKLTGEYAHPDPALIIEESPSETQLGDVIYTLLIPDDYPYAIARREWYTLGETKTIIIYHGG